MEPLTQRKNILITNITNPFDPMHNREFKEAPQGLSLKECIDLVKDPLDGCYYVAAVNGSVVPEGTDYSLVYPQGNVVLCATPQGGGGGKNPLRTILQIVVIVVAAAATWYLGGAGGIPVASMLGIGTLFGMQMMALAAGLAIAVVGNILVSALLPYDMGDISTGADQNQSATYSWSAPSNSNREGVVWPVLYGTMRISPPIIGKYIEVSGDKQYLNILYAIADHPITSIDETSITLNGNTVTNGVDGVSWTYRLGSLTQTALPYFRDAITTKSVGSKIGTTWTVIDVDGTQTEGLGVAFSLPYGLFYANDDGSLGNYTVSLDLEYKEINDTEWTNFFVNYLIITKAQSSAIREVHKIHNLAPGSYQVRTRLHNGVAQSTSTRVKCDTYIDYVESIIYDDFAYPNSAVFALRVQATEKLSGGMPTLSLIATRATVPVWTGSAYENKPADNPAWASYDALHDSNYGGSVPASRIIYADFAAWASNCDTHYIRDGVTSPTSFKCNYYIDTSMSLRKILNNIGQLGRGNTVQIGSNFTCFVDKLESLPAQSFIFNMGNINSKSFNVEYANLDNRANAVDITFWDKDQDYKQRTIEIHAADFDEATTEIKKTQITLYGCTSFAEALKHGYFALNNNRLLTITANFDADVDSLACMPWDVIEVQHDVTMWGEGGRILAATESTIVLDKEITREANKSYTLRVQLSESDHIDEYVLTPVETETTSAQWTITTTFDPIPEQYDKWVITATGSATKLFRLIKTSRQSELTRKLVCLEYNPDIYDDSGILQPPELPTLPVYEAHLRAIEVQEWNGSPNTAVHLSWTGLALSWNVFWKRADDTLYNYAGKTTTPFYRLTQIDLRADAYTFCVSHTEHPADGITVDLTLQGYSIIVPANTPLNLTANLRGQVIILEWDTPTDATVTGHTIYLNGTAICVNYTGTAYVYGNTLTAGVYNFTIAAVNKGGESEQTDAASITISVPATPAPSAAIVGENVVVSWADCKTSLPIDYYLINSTKQGSAHRYIDRINWVGEKTYEIIAVDTSGNQSVAGTTSITVTGITTPTEIVATGFTYAIRLDLTYQTFADFDVVEIWSSETNDRGTALKVGETSAAAWTHSGLNLIDTRFYWTRIRNLYGTTGDWYPASATAGIECSTSTDPTDYLTILDGNLDSSPLLDILTEPILEWNSTIAYNIDEICYLGSIYYKCIKESTNNQPPNATYWEEVDDGLLKQWTVKLNANNHVAGVGMMMDEAGSSEFTILADKFQVVDPGDTMNPKAVFTVGNIDGNSAVGINGDLIIDGSILARNIGANEVIANSANIKDAIITNAKIADATIETAKIKDAQITGAKIAAATIGTANIANAAITGAKIGAATIEAANIATAAITTAKIQDLSVSTIKIANSAVTTLVSYYGASSILLSNNSETFLGSVSISATGNVVLLFVNCDITYTTISYVRFYLYLDGSLVWNTTVGAVRYFSIQKTYLLSSGTHSFVLKGDGYTASISNRSLVALEAKK